MTLPNLVANAVIKEQGILPLWNPWVKFGYPMSAESEMGSLYPPALLMNLPMDYGHSFTIYILFHFILAMGGTWFYCRELGLTHAGRTIAVLIFVFSGSFIAQIVDLPLVTTFAWTPLVLAFQLRSMERKSLGWAALAGLVVGVQMLGAHPQMCLYMGLMTLPQGILGVKDGLKFNNIFLAMRVIAVLYLVGFSIGAPQLLYNYELLRFTERGFDIPSEFLLSHSLPPHHLLQAIIPYLLGSESNYVGGSWFAEMHLFLSFSAIGLLIIGFADRKKHSSYFAFFFLFFIILSLGRYSVVYELLLNLPGFNVIRVPARMLLPASLSAGILAGMGLDSLVEKRTNLITWAKRIFVLYIIISAFLICIGAIGLLGAYGSSDVIEGYYRELTNLFLHEKRGLPWYLLDENSAAFKYRMLSAMRNMGSSAAIGAFFTMMLAAWWYLYRKYSGNKYYPIILIATCALELWIFEYNTTRYAKADYYKNIPALAKELLKDKDSFRIASLTLDDMLDPDLSNLPSSVPVLYGIATTGTYLSMTHVRLNKYLSFSAASPKRLAAGNVKYIITSLPLPETLQLKSKRGEELKKELPQAIMDKEEFAGLLNNNGLHDLITNAKEIAFDGKRHLYELNNSMLRAFLTERFEIIENSDELLRRLDSQGFNPAQTALLEERPEMVKGKTAHYLPKAPEIQMKNYGASNVEIEVITPYDGILVLNDMHHPGWKATVNGTNQKIYQANYLFRGLYLGKGRHEIIFHYHPESFFTGLAIATAAVVILLLWAGIKLWPFKKPEPDNGPQIPAPVIKESRQ